ncbi:MAG: hypothetical protein M1331_03025 [Candidatus Marsarchaeota archaeon]|nr:hypothetical protein [Candidatus Marsarchaeota archaeon]MCL5106339.1 hypothetical protein [Candidatus Marsarchaeota archaeon]
MAFGSYYIALSIIAIMMGVAGIILGIGIALNEKSLKEFGKSELFQSFVNGAIVLGLVAVFSKNGLITQIINSIVLKSSTSLSCAGFEAYNYAICFAYNFLTGINGFAVNGVHFASLFAQISGMLAAVSSVYVAIALISSLKFNFIIGISLSAIFTPLLSVLGSIITTIVFSMLSIEVQAALLKFAGIASITILLPIGIVLRTFYFTRKLGGAIIALSIGLFCIFPLTYLLNAQLISSYASSTGLAGLVQSTSQLKASVINSAGSATNSTSQGILASLDQAVSGFSSYFWGAMNSVINEIALVIVEVFFLPALSIMLTIISIREMAKILGSEISLGRFDIF